MELMMYKDSDLALCTKIYTAAFEAPPVNYGFITPEKATRYITDLTKTPGFLGYTYWQNGIMAAFCFGKLDNYFDGSVFKVEELAVHPGFHRQGIGTTVMQLMEEKLRFYRVSAISLQTSKDIPAYNFYVKNGYEEIQHSVCLAKMLS